MIVHLTDLITNTCQDLEPDSIGERDADLWHADLGWWFTITRSAFLRKTGEKRDRECWDCGSPCHVLHGDVTQADGLCLSCTCTFSSQKRLISFHLKEKRAGSPLCSGMLLRVSISVHLFLNMPFVRSPCKVVVLHNLNQLRLPVSHVSLLMELTMEGSSAQVALYLDFRLLLTWMPSRKLQMPPDLIIVLGSPLSELTHSWQVWHHTVWSTS